MLRYRVALPHPERHLVEVTLRFAAGELPPEIVIEMPAWCPGSYLIRDYARYVRGLAATGDGKALPCEQISKRAWRIARGAAREVEVSYGVYGHDLSVRTNHIDHSHAFLHGPAVFVFPTALRDAPVEVEVELPAGRSWHVATGLGRRGEVLIARDVDHLLDCPLHLGEVDRRELKVAGKPIHLVVWGRREAHTPFGLDDLARDLAPIVARHAERFAAVPFDDYTFVLMLSPGAYGGLEHESSSINLASPFAFSTRKGYAELLELLSHELFHAWNGKRLRPTGFDRFDYGGENYTRCLWLIEGATSYYDRATCVQAKVVPLEHYFSKLAEEWGKLLAVPGRRQHSLEAASLNAWVKLYKPDESNLNTTVSYYLKGGLVWLCLDLALRERSSGAVGTDLIMVELWRRFGAVGRGYPEDLEASFTEAAGLSLAELFAEQIRGTADPDLAGALATVGLVVRAGPDKPDEPPPCWLGVTVAPNGRAITGVVDGGPGQAAGLSPGDEIVALSRYHVASEADVRARLAGHAAGDAVEVAVFRRGQLELVTVELALAPAARYEIASVAEPSPQARARFEAWLGVAHPGPGFSAVAQVPAGL